MVFTASPRPGAARPAAFPRNAGKGPRSLARERRPLRGLDRVRRGALPRGAQCLCARSLRPGQTGSRATPRIPPAPVKSKESSGWSCVHRAAPQPGTDYTVRPSAAPARTGGVGTGRGQLWPGAAAPAVRSGTSAFAGRAGGGGSRALQTRPPTLGAPPAHAHPVGRHSAAFGEAPPAVLGGPATSPGPAEAREVGSEDAAEARGGGAALSSPDLCADPGVWNLPWRRPAPWGLPHLAPYRLRPVGVGRRCLAFSRSPSRRWGCPVRRGALWGAFWPRPTPHWGSWFGPLHPHEKGPGLAVGPEEAGPRPR